MALRDFPKFLHAKFVTEPIIEPLLFSSSFLVYYSLINLSLDQFPFLYFVQHIIVKKHDVSEDESTAGYRNVVFYKKFRWWTKSEIEECVIESYTILKALQCWINLLFRPIFGFIVLKNWPIMAPLYWQLLHHHETWILHIVFLCGFRRILRINSNYFSRWHWPNYTYETTQGVPSKTQTLLSLSQISNIIHSWCE